MGEIKNLQSGNSFQVVQRKTKTNPSEGMTIAQTAKFNQTNRQEQAEIANLKSTFGARYAENGKVELLVEGSDGIAVVQGNRISLAELSQKGNALAEYALELKKFDEDGDNHITEDELFTSWGERGASAGTTIALSTGGGAATGAGIGAWFAGVGALPGAGVGALLSGVGSTLWEGVKTIGYATGDKYNTAGWAR